MTFVHEWINAVNDNFLTIVLIVVLLALGIWFTYKTDFVQFKLFPEMFRVILDKRMVRTGSKKGTSAFQAFAISAAARVGTGNLAGVATAVAAGGPGAVFWMWVIALLGSASAFVESTLAQVYKVPDGNEYRGGPAYYMEKGLKSRGMAIAFAIIITLTYGLVFNSVQSNTISLAFSGEFKFNNNLMAIILVLLTAIVIFGGLRSIANVTQVIVPVMAVLYVLIAVFVLLINITAVPHLLGLILENAFGIRQIAGGGFGAAIMMGIKRGLFSNEAGMGSSPNAAATSEVTHPAKQGLIQALGVFFDTILICSATAFIILSAGNYEGSNADGIQLTQQAFQTHIGEWAAIFIGIAIFLFAYSSILGNYFYGESNISYMKNSKVALFFYRIAVLAMVGFGAVASFEFVWDLADLAMSVMALLNLYAAFKLFKIANRVLQDYRQQRKAGKDPVFYRDILEDDTGVEYWDRQEMTNENHH